MKRLSLPDEALKDEIGLFIKFEERSCACDAKQSDAKQCKAIQSNAKQFKAIQSKAMLRMGMH
jgi:hypothetical protein